MGNDQQLFKRVLTVFGAVALLLVIILALSDSLLAFAAGTAVTAGLVILVLAAGSLFLERWALRSLAGIYLGWKRLIAINVISWIGGYIAALLIGILPSLLVGNWIISVLQVFGFAVMATWLCLAWEADDLEDETDQAPAARQEPEDNYGDLLSQ